MPRIRQFVAAVGCLLLVRADCFAHRPAGVPLSELPLFLETRICWHFSESPPKFGYHECAIAPFPSMEACAMEVRPYIEDSVQAAIDAGLHYSEDCMDRSLYFANPPTLPSGTWLDCENDCQIFHGDLPEGTPCDSFGHRMSDCGQGLVCAPDRTCHAPCDFSFVAPNGGFCGPVRGMWGVTCDAGLACNADGTCEPAATLGSACDLTTPCAVEGWCNPDTASCIARRAAPSPCGEHEQCVSNLCVGGECVESQWLECGRWGW